jgi:CHAT domain-containing protein
MAAGGPIRLSFSAYGGRLTCSVAQETLSHKAVLAFDEARIAAASRDAVAVLTRGNRQRKLTDALVADLRTIGEDLYRALIPASVQHELRLLEKVPLLLDIDEGLVAVPWELLFDGESFLCRRFDLGRAVATPQPLRAQGARRMSNPARMLVLCSDAHGDLPSVVREGHAIEAALEHHPGVRVRVCGAKPLDFIRKSVKDFDIVHFAGHADYDRGDPEASGWHLQDGKFTARDVASLAGGRPMPLLVFSNACQSSHEENWTAADPGRVFGLANAFLLSGVKYYIGTQWEIVDALSEAFATAFYSELARGRSVGAAMRRARGSVVVAEGEGALGWAGYVLYGDPAFVPLTGDAAVSLPGMLKMPTPAEIVSRESIKAVAKHSGPYKLRGGGRAAGGTPGLGVLTDTPVTVTPIPPSRSLLTPPESLPTRTPHPEAPKPYMSGITMLLWIFVAAALTAIAVLIVLKYAK